jgi:hypothetical protein
VLMDMLSAASSLPSECLPCNHRVHIGVEMKYGEFTPWSVHCNFVVSTVRDGNRVQGGGRAPPPSPARADFSITMDVRARNRCVYSVPATRIKRSNRILFTVRHRKPKFRIHT